MQGHCSRFCNGCASRYSIPRQVPSCDGEHPETRTISIRKAVLNTYGLRQVVHVFIDDKLVSCILRDSSSRPELSLCPQDCATRFKATWITATESQSASCQVVLTRSRYAIAECNCSNLDLPQVRQVCRLQTSRLPGQQKQGYGGLTSGSRAGFLLIPCRYHHSVVTSRCLLSVT